jgi:hypothetical protein
VQRWDLGVATILGQHMARLDVSVDNRVSAFMKISQRQEALTKGLQMPLDRARVLVVSQAIQYIGGPWVSVWQGCPFAP